MYLSGLRQRNLKHQEVYRYLRFLMEKNQLKKGDPLPTEMELCQNFKCSRRTVRKAVELLVKEGKAERRRGSGTYVLDPHHGTEAGLASKRCVGAIVPNVFNAETARFVRALWHICRERNEWVVLGVTNDMPNVEAAFIEELASLRVRGVVKFPTNPECEDATRDRLRLYGIPFVVVNDFWCDCRRDHLVAYDECQAVEMIVDHLVRLGHRDIMLVESKGWPRVRAVSAFLGALRRHNLPHDNGQVLLYELYNPPPVRQLLARKSGLPSALVTIYELVALPLLRELHRCGVRVPEDVSLANVNGLPLEIPDGLDLTATVPPFTEMAEQTLDILESAPSEKHIRHCLYPPTFHEGQTIGPCSRAASVQKVRMELPAVAEERG